MKSSTKIFALMSSTQISCRLRRKSDLEIQDFKVVNEPILGYLQGSKERTALESALAKHGSQCEDIPIVIGGKEYRTDNVQYQVMPHDHQKKVAKFYWATPELVQLSIDTALAAKKDWEAVPINDKIQMFLKVADQMADQYRADLNATTMLGQAKTIIQAEIDSACELIDFFRFNCFFAKELHGYQPIRGPFNHPQPPPVSRPRGFHRLSHPLQLHRHSRQPGLHALRHGQRQRVEAQRHRHPLQLSHLQDLPRRRLPRRCCQLRSSRRASLRKGCDGTSRPGQRQLHRVGADLPVAVEGGRGEPAELRRLPQADRRVRREELSLRPPDRRGGDRCGLHHQIG